MAAPANDGDDLTGVAVTHGESTEIALAEHRANLERTRRLVTAGIPAVTVLALFGLFGIHSGKYHSLALLWLPQLAVIVAACALRRRLQRKPQLSPRGLRLADMGLFASLSAAVALICVDSGGFTSDDIHALLLVLIAQSLAQAVPYRRGAFRLATTVLGFPVAMLAASPFVPGLAGQLRDPAVLGVLAQRLALILAGGALLVVGGHAFWAARRQIIETRAVGRYVLKKRIGVGGMGEVWSAFHPVLKRDVAVKILRADRTNPDMITRFEREIAAMTGLSHPNTVRVMDCGTTDDGLLYFVMELVDGDTLKALVAREGPLSPARAVHILRQTARALAEAHAHGIVHRDIKPDNILVTSMGGEPDFVKVMDFGIAKLAVVDDHDAALTHAGMLVGTPTYMSPEQAAARHVDARSDLYSLGGLLFFALTGRPPFQGSLSTLLLAHLSDVAPRPSTYSPHAVSPELDALVQRCLAKSPDSRHLSALDLDAALAAVPLGEAGPRRAAPPFDPDATSVRERPTVRPGGPRASTPPLPAAASTPSEARSHSPDDPAVTRIIAVRDPDAVDATGETVCARPSAFPRKLRRV